jgi:hypothetical protein
LLVLQNLYSTNQSSERARSCLYPSGVPGFPTLEKEGGFVPQLLQQPFHEENLELQIAYALPEILHPDLTTRVIVEAQRCSRLEDLAMAILEDLAMAILGHLAMVTTLVRYYTSHSSIVMVGKWTS